MSDMFQAFPPEVEETDDVFPIEDDGDEELTDADVDEEQDDEEDDDLTDDDTDNDDDE